MFIYVDLYMYLIHKKKASKAFSESFYESIDVRQYSLLAPKSRFATFEPQSGQRVGGGHKGKAVNVCSVVTGVSCFSGLGTGNAQSEVV